jgi:hypothetical protein
MRDHRFLLLVVVLIAGLAAAACGTSEEAEPGPGQKVPFIVCASSASWTRPSEEEQARHIWDSSRYRRVDRSFLRETFYEGFVVWHGGASEMVDIAALHGLWHEDRLPPGPECDRGPGLFRGESISVYLLLHEARDVRLRGNTYHIVVQETPSGFQEIQFTNLLFPEQPTEEYPQIDYQIVVVDGEGQELARLR